MGRPLDLPFANMIHEQLNLTPRPRVRAFRRTYFLRLAMVAALAVTFLCVADSILLVPSYVYERVVLAERQHALDALTARLSGTEERNVVARLAALESDSAYLLRLGSTSPASASLRRVLAVPRPGITLSSIAFTAASPQAHLLVSGKAGDRLALRQYLLALRAVPNMQSAEVPLSTYADETDIRFTATLTGVFLP